MAQNDFVIADQSAASALSDINSALQSLASCSSGASEPATKYANQLWYDTTSNILKIRNEANSAWISMLYIHQADNAAHVLDNTYISDTSGNHVGLLGDQATVEWQSGTGATESLVSPAKIKAAIDAVVATKVVDYSAGYTNLSRASGQAYQNTKTTPIIIYYEIGYNVGAKAEVGPNGSTWYQIHGNGGSSDPAQNSLYVPPSHWYRLTSAGGITRCVQLG